MVNHVRLNWGLHAVWLPHQTGPFKQTACSFYPTLRTKDWNGTCPSPAATRQPGRARIAFCLPNSGMLANFAPDETANASTYSHGDIFYPVTEPEKCKQIHSDTPAKEEILGGTAFRLTFGRYGWESERRWEAKPAILPLIIFCVAAGVGRALNGRQALRDTLIYGTLGKKQEKLFIDMHLFLRLVKRCFP